MTVVYLLTVRKLLTVVYLLTVSKWLNAVYLLTVSNWLTAVYLLTVSKWLTAVYLLTVEVHGTGAGRQGAAPSCQSSVHCTWSSTTCRLLPRTRSTWRRPTKCALCCNSWRSPMACTLTTWTPRLANGASVSGWCSVCECMCLHAECVCGIVCVQCACVVCV